MEAGRPDCLRGIRAHSCGTCIYTVSSASYCTRGILWDTTGNTTIQDLSTWMIIIRSESISLFIGILLKQGRTEKKERITASCS